MTKTKRAESEDATTENATPEGTELPDIPASTAKDDAPMTNQESHAPQRTRGTETHGGPARHHQPSDRPGGGNARHEPAKAEGPEGARTPPKLNAKTRPRRATAAETEDSRVPANDT